MNAVIDAIRSNTRRMLANVLALAIGLAAFWGGEGLIQRFAPIGVVRGALTIALLCTVIATINLVRVRVGRARAYGSRPSV
jgi:hypothetical protein